MVECNTRLFNLYRLQLLIREPLYDSMVYSPQQTLNGFGLHQSVFIKSVMLSKEGSPDFTVRHATGLPLQ